MASMASWLTLFFTLNSLTFFPFIAINLLALLNKFFASEACSFWLAETVSAMSMLLASKNLDARVQDVQPLRK